MTALDRLSNIIPPDIALANKALSTSMQQITGVKNMPLPTFAGAVSAVQTMTGLPLIQAQTAAVSPATANYYTSSLGGGTGPGGAITVGDVIGSAAGYNETTQLQDAVTQFTSMNLTTLTEIYTRMVNTLNGDYGTSPVIIPAGPAAGTYADYDTAFTGVTGDITQPGLIPTANTEIVSLVANYPTQTSALNVDWNTIAQQLVTEATQQSRAKLNYSQLIANDQNSVYSFIFSLPTYGKDVATGGMNYMITSTADQSTLTGQAIIAVLRQGPTTDALNAAGIGTNNNIPLN